MKIYTKDTNAFITIEIKILTFVRKILIRGIFRGSRARLPVFHDDALIRIILR